MYAAAHTDEMEEYSFQPGPSMFAKVQASKTWDKSIVADAKIVDSDEGSASGTDGLQGAPDQDGRGVSSALATTLWTLFAALGLMALVGVLLFVVPRSRRPSRTADVSPTRLVTQEKPVPGWAAMRFKAAHMATTLLQAKARASDGEPEAGTA